MPTTPARPARTPDADRPDPAQDAEQAEREQAITDEVVASFAGAPDERFRTVMVSLVRHLHGFVRDVRLTEPEWAAAVAFLTRTGQTCTPTRQEFILLSDVLGASMQTIAVNNEARAGAVEATEATVFGPFFVEAAPVVPLGGDVSFGAAGQPCWVEGTVSGIDGAPVPGAVIDVWECDEDGLYDVQYGDGRTAARGQLVADERGRYRFWALTPVPYPIPDDGPVGDLLGAAARSPMRAPHLHFMVAAPGFRTLVTHIFVAGDPQLDHDSVFGVKDSLIKDFELHPRADPPPDGRVPDGDWASVHFDVVLAPTER